MPNQRCLAATVRADNSQMFAGLDLQGCAAQSVNTFRLISVMNILQNNQLRRLTRSRDLSAAH